MTIFFKQFDKTSSTNTDTQTASDKPSLLWLHGWGQDHRAFMGIAEGLPFNATHYLLDFPGFGQSEQPNTDWDTEAYADAIKAWLETQKIATPIIWVGHSFGGRVGIQFAAKYPDLITHLCLVAGAGLKQKKSPWKTATIKARIKLFKSLKKRVPEGETKRRILSHFGSKDFQSAGKMRGILTKVVNEDLLEKAATITCPTTLIYGELDGETPPEFGERFAASIKQAELHVLPQQDHYSLLGSGMHPVIRLLNLALKSYF